MAKNLARHKGVADNLSSTPQIARPRRRAQALAIVTAVLIAIAGLLLWFTVDPRLPRNTASLYGPAILLLTAPLLFAAHRLGRANDGTGPLVAGIVSLVIVLGVLGAALWLFAKTPSSAWGWAFYIAAGLLSPPINKVTWMALLVLIVLPLLAAEARHLWRASTDRRLRAGADGLATAAVMLASATGMRTRPVMVASAGTYDVTTAQHELLHAYSCLRRVAGAKAVNGFPATLGACEWPGAAPGSAAYGSGYLLEYHPTRLRNDGRGAGFALVTMDAGHRNPESFYLDESGAVRRAVGARATGASPVWVQQACLDFDGVIHKIEEYRAANPTVGYPARIEHYDPRPDSSGDGVLRTLMMSPSDSIVTLSDGSIKMRSARADRALIYRRVGDGYTLSLFTPDSLPRPGATLMDDPGLDELRNFFRDSTGAVHVTGEQRPATVADPVRSLTICD